jgi:serine/threonine protein phosphatase PrpC
MNPAVLRGREQTVIGTIAAIAEGRCAIALSRGGAPKTYRHRDLNEDVAGFANGEEGSLVAVADGHAGCGAAETAVDHLITRYAPLWTAANAPGLDALWESTARAAFADVNQVILGRAVRDGAGTSRTTLAFAVFRRSDDLLLFASVGDSHVFRVDAEAAVDLASDPDRQTAFLGSPQETRESLRQKCVIGCTRLAGARAVVAVTDGISERGIGVAVPADAVSEAIERGATRDGDLRPLTAARAAVETALEAHRRHRAGDNIACAVAWLEI